MASSKAKLLEKRKAGRPREYDPDKIADELLEWSKDEESINIAQFCADRGYLPGLIWRLEKESDEFSYAYTIARLKLAERRERLMNNNLLNYGAWQRYQRGYDPFLAKDEDDKEDKDAARKKGIVETEQMNLVMLAKLAAAGEISQKE
jgi:hypothetical protein